MNERIFTPACMTLLAIFMAPVRAHEPPAEGCGAFSSELAHELRVMREAAVSATSTSGASRALPRLQLDTRYAINLAGQDRVRFAAKPARFSKSPSLRGGAFQFEVPTAGRYRVSITSRHWIDVVDAESVLESVHHFGPGCDLVHKVVEFDLPAGRPLTLQVSGQDDAIIGLAITAATPAARDSP